MILDVLRLKRLRTVLDILNVDNLKNITSIHERVSRELEAEIISCDIKKEINERTIALIETWIKGGTMVAMRPDGNSMIDNLHKTDSPVKDYHAAVVRAKELAVWSIGAEDLNL